MASSSTSSEPVVANPAPLGLAGFALTTFLLSAVNAGLLTSKGDAWMGFALFYGGAAQLLAGMWEFKAKNTFGATAFSSYGAFWLSTAFYVWFWAPKSGSVSADLTWILGAWAIFTGYMMLNALKINNPPVLAVFIALFITFVLLWAGDAFSMTMMHTAGGYVGLVTAALAWYASYVGIQKSLA